METMEKVIENVNDVAPAEVAQTAVKVATTKPNHNAVKTGGIIAGVLALVAGVGYVIYSAIKGEKTAEAPEAEVHEDNESHENDEAREV